MAGPPRPFSPGRWTRISGFRAPDGPDYLGSLGPAFVWSPPAAPAGSVSRPGRSASADGSRCGHPPAAPFARTAWPPAARSPGPAGSRSPPPPPASPGHRRQKIDPARSPRPRESGTGGSATPPQIGGPATHRSSRRRQGVHLCPRAFPYLQTIPDSTGYAWEDNLGGARGRTRWVRRPGPSSIGPFQAARGWPPRGCRPAQMEPTAAATSSARAPQACAPHLRFRFLHHHRRR